MMDIPIQFVERIKPHPVVFGRWSCPLSAKELFLRVQFPPSPPNIELALEKGEWYNQAHDQTAVDLGEIDQKTRR